MNSANTEWIKLSERPPTSGSPALLWDATRKHATYIDSPSGLPVSQDYTHWMPLQPPPRPKTLEDIDREAYDHWATSTGQITQRSAWLAARASLREEHAVALKEFIESPAGMTNGVWVNREGFYKLTALLKGEQ